MGTIIPFPQPEPPDRKKWEDLWLSPSDESLIQEVIDRFGLVTQKPHRKEKQPPPQL